MPHSPTATQLRMEKSRDLSCHVKTQRHNMGVQHGSVERRDEQIFIGEHDGHGTVDDAVRAVDESLRLVRVARGLGCEGEGGECQVELRAPCDPGRRAGGGGCHVAVIGTNRCEICQRIAL